VAKPSVIRKSRQIHDNDWRLMTEPPAPNVTELLEDLSAGKEHALDDLLPLVHNELRRQAARYLRRERHNHTLQPTALVNEAFIRLVDQRNVRWQNRAHFFGIAAQAMRRILIDHARTQQRIKRGGVQQNVTLDEGMLAAAARSIDVLALDQALTRLASIDARQARVVELRFFGGLSVEETAAIMAISAATVKREWSMAKAWLYTQLTR
jgi:RNA polymerase sigma-70 factor, ECF subfamily